MLEQKEIHSKVLEAIEGYPNDEREIVEGLNYNAYQNFRTIEFYTSSKYLNGQFDELGRDIPFRNVVNFRLNTAVKATEFDTKDIQLTTDEGGDYVATMLLSRELHDWFKEENFAQTINQMIYVRPKYGELMVKKVEKQGKLCVDIVDWRNIVVDPSEPLKSLVVEKHYFRPHELYTKRKSWKHVDEVLSSDSYETKNVLGATNTSKDDLIMVYEVYGYFKPEDLGLEGEDYKLYKVIMTDEYLMDYKEITELPYKTLSWEKVYGRLGRGIIEDGFEAQVWTNDAVRKERDMMEISSKIFWKTTDDRVEDNALVGLDNGSIIHLQDGKDFVQVNAVPSSLPQLNSIMQAWDNQYQQVSSSFDSVTGDNLPSRTPFRTASILNQSGSSMFNLRRQEFGIFITEIIYDWVLPFLIKQISSEHILASNFSSDELKMIDEGFANWEANKLIKTRALTGTSAEEIVTPQPMIDELKAKVLGEVGKTKARRFISIPKDYFKDIKAKVDIITTGENVDKGAMFESLNNIFIAYAQNAEGVRNDPVLSKLFERIVDLSGIGISPQELKYDAKSNQNQPTVPGQGNPGGPQGVLPAMPGQASAPAGV